jgi:hypothetical protein
LLRKTRPCSTGQARPAATYGFSGLEPTGGPVFRVFLKAAHDEPGCFDQVFLQFMKDSIAGRTPNVQSIGVSYMYGGFWVPNKSHAMGSGNEFHVGPHIMILGLDQKMMQTLNHDGSNGEPYVNHLPGRSELYLVIPIREWDDAQAVRSAIKQGTR